MIKKIAAGVLLVLGFAMVFLGVRAGIEAPVVTGVGFFVIAAVFGFDSRG
jgi:uncharacterized membrane protein YbaN (DUF454 family)